MTGCNSILGDERTPSPQYSGERAGVRGVALAAPVVVPRPPRDRSLTLTLSPEYWGEGMEPHAAHETNATPARCRGRTAGLTTMSPRRTILSLNRPHLHPL